jgi:hypothetical protein
LAAGVSGDVDNQSGKSISTSSATAPVLGGRLEVVEVSLELDAPDKSDNQSGKAAASSAAAGLVGVPGAVLPAPVSHEGNSNSASGSSEVSISASSASDGVADSLKSLNQSWPPALGSLLEEEVGVSASQGIASGSILAVDEGSESISHGSSASILGLAIGG